MIRAALSLAAFSAFAALFFLPACESTCHAHEDCDSDELCLFSTGHCSPRCDPAASDSCPANQRCDACATSSCENCRNCLAACVEVVSGASGPGGW